MFNLNDYIDQRVAVHCKTEEEAKDFCNVMHNYGWRWAGTDAHSLRNKNNWHMYKDDTCYKFNWYSNDITFSCTPFYSEKNYKILEWSDFMKKKVFTKSDLKTGDFLVQRNGLVEIINVEVGGAACQSGNWNSLLYINEGLTHCHGYDYDTIQVYRPTAPNQCCFNNYKNGELLFDRERDYPTIKELSIADLEKQYGCKVKIIK